MEIFFRPLGFDVKEKKKQEKKDTYIVWISIPFPSISSQQGNEYSLKQFLGNIKSDWYKNKIAISLMHARYENNINAIWSQQQQLFTEAIYRLFIYKESYKNNTFASFADKYAQKENEKKKFKLSI